jgi:CBS domain-containing protein
MRVVDIMQTAVRTVTGDTPISEVVISLADAQVSGLPVVDARGRVIGVVSSTDVIAAQAETQSAQERHILLEQTPVRELMTPKPLMIEATAELKEAARHSCTRKCVGSLSKRTGFWLVSSRTLTSCGL